MFNDPDDVRCTMPDPDDDENLDPNDEDNYVFDSLDEGYCPELEEENQ